MPSPAASASARQFRILALPLARLPKALPSHSTPTSSSTPLPPATAPPEPPLRPPTPLVLFHVSQPDAPTAAGPPSLSKRALDKASEQWLKLAEKPKTSWTYWCYKKGEGLMDKIEYEEWALKTITEGRGVKVLDEEAKKQGGTQEIIEIPLLKPTFKDAPLPPLLPKLHRLLIHRIPYHRKMMWRSIIAVPLTWPFAIIPIIPNFPMFYVLWRVWSHWKAYRGALYLEQLLKLGMIVEKPSTQLDKVYQSKGIAVGEEGSENHAPDQTSGKGAITSSTSGPQINEADAAALPAQAKGEVSPDGTATPETMVYEPKSETRARNTLEAKEGGVGSGPRHPGMLLAPNQVTLMARLFDFRPQEVLDVNRAVEQADIRAKAVDKQNTEGGQGGQSEGGQTQGSAESGEEGKKGTEWRGNLHR